MATDSEVIDVAIAARELSIELKRWVYRARQFMAKNSAMALDWGAEEFPNAGAITNGTITGKNYGPDEVSNVIGSFDAIANTAWATHGGNVEKLCDPLT